MTELSHCLWFNGQAEEAANWYCSVIPNSHMGAVIRSPVDTPSGPEGSILLVEFTLAGQPYSALNGGPEFTFSPAISLVLSCDTQEEVDRVWEAMLDGGQPMACGWITDRYGVSWQVVPKGMEELFSDSDPKRAERAMKAMLGMKKLEIAELRRAAEEVPA